MINTPRLALDTTHIFSCEESICKIDIPMLNLCDIIIVLYNLYTKKNDAWREI